MILLGETDAAAGAFASAGLSPVFQADVFETIKRVNGAGVTIVMVEHDMGLVGRVADRVMAINDGRLLTIGTPEEVRNDPAVQQAYLGTAA